MRLILIVLFLLLTVFEESNGQMQPLSAIGRIKRIENFQSKYVLARNIDIWLPDGYSSADKYAVLYMQDGQMLFDPEITWNKEAWRVDQVAGNLAPSHIF